MVPRSLRFLALVASMAVGIILFTGCRPTRPAAPPLTPGPNEAIVKMADFVFSPVTLTINPGTTVIWLNDDATGHTISSTEPGVFESGSVLTGGSYRFTFNQNGTFPYYCQFHPWMKGTITVREAANPTPEQTGAGQ